MTAHFREGSHQTGTFPRGARDASHIKHPGSWDLHQREEPLKCLALKTNGADIQWSQSAIENWEPPPRKGLTCDLTHLETQGNNSGLESVMIICEGESFSNLKASAGGVVDSRNTPQKQKHCQTPLLHSPPHLLAQAYSLDAGVSQSWQYPTALLKPESSRGCNVPPLPA